MNRLVILGLLVAACGGGTTVIYVTPPPTSAPPVEAQPTDPPVEAFAGMSGEITFGTKYDPDTLAIFKPLTRFKRTFPEIAWSAEFSREPGTTTINWILVRQSSGGSEETLYNQEQTIGSPDYTIIANSADLAFLVGNKSGTYVMRYVESGDILAEGSFKLVK